MTRNPNDRIKLHQHSRRVGVRLQGALVAETEQSVQLTEQGYPDRQYLPVEALVAGELQPSDTRTYCPFKGEASYFHFVLADQILRDAVWMYERPLPSMTAIAGRIVFDSTHFQENVEPMPTKTDNNPATPQHVSDRLPCRGCTKDCANYASCNGTPWRRENPLAH